MCYRIQSYRTATYLRKKKQERKIQMSVLDLILACLGKAIIVKEILFW